MGEWLAQPTLNTLTRGDTLLHVRPQLMDVLVCLARHPGRVVLKDNLLAEVWPDRFVSESGLVRCVAELRQLLGDSSREPRYIETIAKRGYRLIAPVDWLETAADAAPARLAPPIVEARGGDHSEGSRKPDGSEAAQPETATARSAAGWRSWRWWPFAPLLLAALLVAAFVAVYMGRSSARTLTEQDLVVLAFENATGDAVFRDTLPLALSIQLEQSPFLRILSAERVREVLQLMKRPADTPVTRALGMEICERAGATVLIIGSITSLGQHYAIGLEAVACVTGESIGRQQVEVPAKDAVLAGVAEVASALRRKLGESVASIAGYSVPITEATTPSLEALRIVRRGDAARERGQAAEALGLYREAVKLDPDFALAYVRLGSLALAAHFEAEGVAAADRAYALRQNVTLPERLEIELLYHWNRTGDLEKITDTLVEMRRAYPHMVLARRGLAQHYIGIGRYEAALGEALETLRLEPKHALSYQTVAQAYLFLNRLAAARQTVESAAALGVDTEMQHWILLQVGFLTGDSALVARERTWAASHEEATPWFLEAEAEDAVWHGRLRDALDFLERYEQWALARGAEHRASVLRLRMARYEALCGRTAEARARVTRELAAGLTSELKVEALKVAVSAGDLALVERLLDEVDREGWPGPSQPGGGFVLADRAALDTARGRPDRALERLRPFIPYELGMLWGFIPLFERAQAHLKAGDWQEARVACEKMLAHSTISSAQKLLPHAQLGVARALAAGGLTDQSRQAYARFFALWKDADPDLPLLAQARREAAALR